MRTGTVSKPLTRFVDYPLRTILVGLLLCAVGATHAARKSDEDSGSDATAAVYPFSSARMYDAPRDKVWNAVVAVLEQRGFNYTQFDLKSGLIITQPQKLRWKKFPGLERFEVPEGYTPFRVELHIFIPRKTPVTRLHINSLVESHQGAATRFTFSSGHVERSIYGAIEESLQTPPIAIPKDHATRKTLMSEISGNEECLVTPACQSTSVPHPTIISESKVLPVYPGKDGRARRESRVTLRVLVDEAGVVSCVELPSGSPPRTEFEITAWKTLDFWRYEPAECDGCPMAVYITAITDFRIHP